MSDKRAIGVFDSGLGGLTVVKELKLLLPNENIVYFGDTGRVPYGTRSRETIRKYAAQDERFLLTHNVKAIIAACGTVSSVASDLASDLPVPYFEVVSHAAKAAVMKTKNKKIGVIGTTATINSGQHKKQIKALMPEAEVSVAGCPMFVPLVEEGWYSADDVVVTETVKRYLKPLIEAGVDTIILGCTHYPVLSEAIIRVVGEDVTLINAGVATSEAVKAYLEENEMLNVDDESSNTEFFVSDKPDSFIKIASVLLEDKIDEGKVEQVNISSL